MDTQTLLRSVLAGFLVLLLLILIRPPLGWAPVILLSILLLALWSTISGGKTKGRS